MSLTVYLTESAQRKAPADDFPSAGEHAPPVRRPTQTNSHSRAAAVGMSNVFSRLLAVGKLPNVVFFSPMMFVTGVLYENFSFSLANWVKYFPLPTLSGDFGHRGRLLVRHEIERVCDLRQYDGVETPHHISPLFWVFFGPLVDDFQKLKISREI